MSASYSIRSSSGKATVGTSNSSGMNSREMVIPKPASAGRRKLPHLPNEILAVVLQFVPERGALLKRHSSLYGPRFEHVPVDSFWALRFVDRRCFAIVRQESTLPIELSIAKSFTGKIGALAAQFSTRAGKPDRTANEIFSSSAQSIIRGTPTQMMQVFAHNGAANSKSFVLPNTFRINLEVNALSCFSPAFTFYDWLSRAFPRRMVTTEDGSAKSLGERFSLSIYLDPKTLAIPTLRANLCGDHVSPRFRFDELKVNCDLNDGMLPPSSTAAGTAVRGLLGVGMNTLRSIDLPVSVLKSAILKSLLRRAVDEWGHYATQTLENLSLTFGLDSFSQRPNFQLLAALYPNVKKLVMTNMDWDIEFDLRPLVAGMPQLEILQMQHAYYDITDLKNTAVVEMAHPNINTLILHTDLERMQGGYRSLKRLIQIAGSNLRTLELLWYKPAIWMQGFYFDVFRVINACPNVAGLESLKLSFHVAREWGLFSSFAGDIEALCKTAPRLRRFSVTADSFACVCFQCMSLNNLLALIQALPAQLVEVELPLMLTIAETGDLESLTVTTCQSEIQAWLSLVLLTLCETAPAIESLTIVVARLLAYAAPVGWEALRFYAACAALSQAPLPFDVAALPNGLAVKSWKVRSDGAPAATAVYEFRLVIWNAALKKEKAITVRLPTPMTSYTQSTE